MELLMSQTGERFPKFLRKKRNALRREIGENDDDSEDKKYYNTQFALKLNLPYKSVSRWLKAKSVERLDIDNFLAIMRVYGKEFIDFLENGEG